MQRRKRPKHSKPSSKSGSMGVTQEQLDEAQLEVRGGLRRVQPYYYTFTSNVKQRMLDRQLLDVMASEFQSESREYYRAAILDGRIRINGEFTKVDHLLRHSDCISHQVHRHEPPVSAEPILVLNDAEDDTNDFVAVCKPASIPVHPTGGYRHNTMLFLLAREHHLNRLFPVHRLDRLTSGVLVFAKSSKAASRVSKMIHSDSPSITKEYVALVAGVFPGDAIFVDKPIGRTDGGLCCVDTERGKPAQSSFELVWSDLVLKRSLVRCTPKTGRTHQLRVHLASLGYPIVGDPLYGADVHLKKLPEGQILNSQGRSLDDLSRDCVSSCPDCSKKIAPDPLPHQLSLCLHAVRYQCDQFEFRAPFPQWAQRNDRVVTELTTATI